MRDSITEEEKVNQRGKGERRERDQKGKHSEEKLERKKS